MSAEVTLKGVLNIAQVESLFKEFEVLEIQGGILNIDAREVLRVDTSILQMLVVFFQSLAQQSIQVKWLGFSDEFRAASQLLGLESELKLIQ